MKRIIFLLIILCQAMIGFAQKGIPFFINFGIEQYEAHSRTSVFFVIVMAGFM